MSARGKGMKMMLILQIIQFTNSSQMIFPVDNDNYMTFLHRSIRGLQKTYDSLVKSMMRAMMMLPTMAMAMVAKACSMPVRSKPNRG
jgi:hypothetical protein